MALAFRHLVMVLIRVFFRRIDVVGRENVPSTGPVVFVANHPNGLLDPLVLRVAVGGPLPFLAKSTFFRNPFGRLAMRAFEAIPVYRQQDGESTGQNEETFARCRALLGAGGRLALYPEGTSHSDPAMRPLRTGAARIALSSEGANDFALGVRIVPVGVFYESKETFRSRVVLHFGPPLGLAAYREAWERNDKEAAKTLTDDVHAALADVVLQAETNEIRNGLVAVAGWTAAPGDEALVRQEERARVLGRRWATLVRTEPERAAALARKARQFERLLAFAGFERPLPDVDALAVFTRFIVVQLSLAPFAFVGALLGFLPYRLVGALARRVKETDIVSTVKVIGGMVFIGGAWAVEAFVAGVLWGPWVGFGLLLAAPATGLAAVRFMERIELRRDVLRGTVLRWSRPRLVELIETRRRSLAEAVDDALEASESI